MTSSPPPIRLLLNRNVVDTVSFRLRCPEIEFIHTEQNPDAAVLLDWCWENTVIPTGGIPDPPTNIPDVSVVWNQYCVLDTYMTVTGMYRSKYPYDSEHSRQQEGNSLRKWLLNPVPQQTLSPYMLSHAVRFCPTRAPLYYHLREYLPSVTTLGVVG